MQLGLTETHWNSQYGNIIRYYSKEHEDLSYTALKIFKNNIFLGSGVKTFYQACNDLERISKKNAGSKEIIMLNDISFFNRNNKIKCSNHPHNFYFQLLSDTGIFSFIFVLLFFGHVLIKNIKILFKKNLNNLDMCFYFLNTGIILNILPLVPSGNFYNNWMALIMFFPLGFWLFINQKIKKNE
jgi:O-antigen ligase